MVINEKNEQAMGTKSGAAVDKDTGQGATDAPHDFDFAAILEMAQAAEERMVRLRQIELSSLDEPFTI